MSDSGDVEVGSLELGPKDRLKRLQRAAYPIDSQTGRPGKFNLVNLLEEGRWLRNGGDIGARPPLNGADEVLGAAVATGGELQGILAKLKPEETLQSFDARGRGVVEQITNDEVERRQASALLGKVSGYVMEERKRRKLDAGKRKEEDEAARRREAERIAGLAKEAEVKRRLAGVKTIYELRVLGHEYPDVDWLVRAGRIADAQQEMYRIKARIRDGYQERDTVSPEQRKRDDWQNIGDENLRLRVMAMFEAWSGGYDAETWQETEKMKTKLLESVAGKELPKGFARISNLVGRGGVLRSWYGEDKSDLYAERLQEKLGEVLEANREYLGTVKPAQLQLWLREGAAKDFAEKMFREVYGITVLEEAIVNATKKEMPVYVVERPQAGDMVFAQEKMKREAVAAVTAAYLKRKRGEEVQVTGVDKSVTDVVVEYLREVGWVEGEIDRGEFERMRVPEKYAVRDRMVGRYCVDVAGRQVSVISGEVDKDSTSRTELWKARISGDAFAGIRQERGGKDEKLPSSIVSFARAEVEGGKEGVERINEFVRVVVQGVRDEKFLEAMGIGEEQLRLMKGADWFSLVMATVRGRFGSGKVSYEIEADNYFGQRASRLDSLKELRDQDDQIRGLIRTAYLAGFMLRQNVEVDRSRVEGELWQRHFAGVQEPAFMAAAMLRQTAQSGV